MKIIKAMKKKAKLALRKRLYMSALLIVIVSTIFFPSIGSE